MNEKRNGPRTIWRLTLAGHIQCRQCRRPRLHRPPPPPPPPPLSSSSSSSSLLLLLLVLALLSPWEALEECRRHEKKGFIQKSHPRRLHSQQQKLKNDTGRNKRTRYDSIEPHIEMTYTNIHMRRRKKNSHKITHPRIKN